ncbi:MAG: tRNA (guanosine(37)-N1)-methyltransferase TrmD [Bacilli bacterium]|nr:tRNA (guanosine(37)-N1)-methyltransferase TrmD [Bacilli bacterium]MDD4282443.1 tRNA (guanosine(37)-N1)-methyltransferase TrmD [Bacilli bacterium]MDD4718914.1 tRNA (guanosine(37)-N1)-methyltransferase TrmD [Bacilli bacterium]
MKIDVLTLFPSMFDDFIKTSIIGRAISDNKVIINVHNIRDFSKDPHKRVDDYGFGGGQGMVLMPEPIFDAIEHFKKSDSLVIMMTPQGVLHNQKTAYELTKYNHLIIVCGHYEGFDERIRSIIDLEISIGDYVLTGGEIPSMVVIDSVVRLLDGVIKKDSHVNESFNNSLLDYPVYTKPQDFRGMKVPEVLLSGHHENIRKWREEESINRTLNRRPDLLERDD